MGKRVRESRWLVVREDKRVRVVVETPLGDFPEEAHQLQEGRGPQARGLLENQARVEVKRVALGRPSGTRSSSDHYRFGLFHRFHTSSR